MWDGWVASLSLPTPPLTPYHVDPLLILFSEPGQLIRYDQFPCLVHLANSGLVNNNSLAFKTSFKNSKREILAFYFTDRGTLITIY